MRSGSTASACPFCYQQNTVWLATKDFNGRRWHAAECRSCGLVFTDPYPTQADIRSFYDGDYHSELRRPGASEKIFGAKFDSYCAWLSQYVRPGKSLDIGCATGLLVKKLQSLGFQAAGFEANAASAAWGREHYAITIHEGILDPQATLLRDFDLITLCDVLEHTLNPMEYLRDLKPLLTPRGRVMVTFPHVWSVESLYLRTISRLFGRDALWNSCKVPAHTWEFTPETARQVFERAGFRILAFRRRNDPGPAPQWQGARSLVQLPTRVLRLPVLGNRCEEPVDSSTAGAERSTVL